MPFDYGRPPLIKAYLLEVAHNSNILLLIVPRLICDSESASILLKELRMLYRPKNDRSLLPLPNQFHEFAADQAAKIRSHQFDKAIDFWLEQWRIFGSPANSYPVLGLKAAKASGTKSCLNATVNAEITSAVKDFCSSHQVSLFVFMLTTLSVCLRARASSNNILVWTTFPNRAVSKTEDMIGPLETVHFIGVDLPKGAEGAQALLKISEAVDRAALNQSVPSSVVWQNLGGLPRRPDELRVTFGLRRGDDADYTPLEGLWMRRLEIPFLPSRHPSKSIITTVVNRKTNFSLQATHSTDRISEETVGSLLADWKEAITLLVSAPKDCLR